MKNVHCFLMCDVPQLSCIFMLQKAETFLIFRKRPGSMTEQRAKHIHWFRTIKYSEWLENIFWKISRYLTACSGNQLTILSGIHLTWSQALTGYMAVFRAESIVHEGANKIFQRASHSTPNTFSGIGFIIQMCRTAFISCAVILDTSLH